MAHPAAGNYAVSLAAIPWQPKPDLTIDLCGAVVFPPFLCRVFPSFCLQVCSPLDLGQAISAHLVWQKARLPRRPLGVLNVG